MAGTIVNNPVVQFFDNNGNPLAGGKITTYLSNTTTPASTWQNEGLSILNTNPIILNSRGEATIWLTPDIQYTFVLTDSNDNLIQTVNDIYGGFQTVNDIPSSSIVGQIPASQIDYTPAGTGAVATTVKDRFDRDVYWVTSTGAVGDGSDEFLLIKAAWDYCLANGKDLYFPDGVWSCGINNFPFKKAEVPVTSLLDCGNITIFGNGPTTVLKTDSIDGADVLQLNGLKNIHFRNFQIEAEISGSIAGSNGISVTGGFDNITARGVTCRDLPSLDKTIFVDGGKALTFQEDGTPNMNTTWGTFVGDIVAIGCAEGLGYEPDLNKIVSSPANVQVNITAVNCYQAVKFAAAEATAALPVGLEAGLRVTGFAVDCQVDVVAARMHGGSIDLSVVTTKTEAARRLNPNNVAWFAAGPDVVSLIASYAKNSKISVKGEKGNCFAKARIGGAGSGSSGLVGATEFADIYLDVSGTASSADIVSIDSGGNTMRLSRLSVTRSTASSIPSDFLLGINSNSVELIGEYKFGNIRFPASQISSIDPNTLDDYEEDGFIPTLTDTSLVDEGATYSLRTGRYTKIGDMVHFSITLSMTGLGTLDPGSSAFVIGLPYPSLLSSANIWQCNAGTTSNLNFSAAAVMQARISAGESYIELRKVLATSTSGDSAMLVSDVSADGFFVISGSYKTAT